MNIHSIINKIKGEIMLKNFPKLNLFRILRLSIVHFLCFLSAGSYAQNYPNKAIRVIIPFAAGSATDTIGRVFGEHMARTLNQPILIDNKVGANGVIGADFVAKSPPDGYTLLLGTNTTIAVIQMLMKSVPYDPDRDFSPISFLGALPQVVTVTNGFPAKSINELISYAQAHPSKINYAWANSAQRVSSEMLASMAGVKFFNVPYKNSPQAMTDLISGEIQLHITDMIVALPHVKSGKARALAVTSQTRSTSLPDVPTVSETNGMSGYEVMGLFALFSPASTPIEIINKLNNAVQKAAEDNEVKSRLATLGLEVQPSTPSELGARMRLEKQRWTKVAKDAGIEPQ